MKRAFSYILVALVSGGITGAIVYKIQEVKHEKWREEEIASLKSSICTRKRPLKVVIDDDDNTDISESESHEEEIPRTFDTSSLMEYYKKTKEYNGDGPEEAGGSENECRPYVISPEEFGELPEEEHAVLSLTYYSDGILADDYNEEVEDVDDKVGYDFASHFGEYEDDAVHIRNDIRHTDYEILKDPRRFVDVIKNKPRNTTIHD